MIEINLVPPQFKKKRKSHLPWKGFDIPLEAVIGLGGGLIILLIAAHVLLLALNIHHLAQHKGLQGQWESLASSKHNVDAVLNELRTLQGKQKSAAGITPKGKILWSQKLNILSDHLPRGVWLKRVALEENALLIEGSAISEQGEEMINVHKFISQLQKQDAFLEHFADIELSSIQRRKIKQVDVADFIITARLK